MAKKTQDGEVTLVSPDGQYQVTTSSAAAINNYVYGQGYSVKKGTVEEALDAVQQQPSTPPRGGDKS
ncbi:MAG TPA: hypothetical protein VM287_04675 [Egibacteraceae bacterium]|jgi:hypothetical protein|nr:hypothetical protein [Egibacteraceae bacterium]HWI02357.1 hypothetical protein [Acidimicrobiales bacterium]